MAHLWVADSNDAWVVVPLEAEALPLTDDARQSACASASPAVAPLLRRARTPDGDAWVVLARAGAFVNGRRLTTGIRVLRDRDEIRVAGASPIFFSSERLPAVEVFPGAATPAYCPRCKQEIVPGAAVRCPQCRIWHHQTDELPCWTYSATCALCDQPAALDGTYRWRPEPLERSEAAPGGEA